MQNNVEIYQWAWLILGACLMGVTIICGCVDMVPDGVDMVPDGTRNKLEPSYVDHTH